MHTPRDAQQLDFLVDQVETERTDDNYVQVIAALRAYGFPIEDVQTALLESTDVEGWDSPVMGIRAAQIRFSSLLREHEGNAYFIGDTLELMLSDFYAATPVRHEDQLRVSVVSNKCLLAFSEARTTEYVLRAKNLYPRLLKFWVITQERQISSFGEWLCDNWLAGHY